MERIYITIT